MSDWQYRESQDGEIGESFWSRLFSHRSSHMLYLDYVALVIACFIVLVVIVYVCRECSCEYFKHGYTGGESRSSSADDLRIVQDDSPPETCSSVDIHHLSHHNFRVLEEYSQRMAQVLQGPPPSYDEAIKDRSPANYHGTVGQTSTAPSVSQRPNGQHENDSESVPLLPGNR
ncbi:uncharacterized protein LOC115919365 [Strongylocentrotus purpuratus]|uniref:Uncharacterized protein n=1 Tax=Strongylocentrotus purpuratus TaxID=7668 RepID=A0A7M7N1P7_STRPU|nr:uncharacterized protein LOC115919365 [Strongylocentrotus purpuratus]